VQINLTILNTLEIGEKDDPIQENLDTALPHQVGNLPKLYMNGHSPQGVVCLNLS
jgi:hypothetical protein